MLPATCPMIMAQLQKYSRWEIKVTVSAENVEKVVNPPRNPVVIASRAASGINAWPLVRAINTPIRKPPMILAASVPNGMVGKIEFITVPNHQRKRAPKAAPILIDKTEIMPMPVSGCEKLTLYFFLISFK